METETNNILDLPTCCKNSPQKPSKKQKKPAKFASGGLCCAEIGRGSFGAEIINFCEIARDNCAEVEPCQEKEFSYRQEWELNYER
jgi:hypothetical protein